MSQAVLFLPPDARQALVCGINDLGFAPQALEVRFSDGRRTEIASALLRDDANDCFDAASGQRLADAVTGDYQIKDVRTDAKGVIVTFTDGTQRVWSYSALSRYGRPHETRIRSASAGGEPTRFDGRAFVDGGDDFRKALAAVASRGVCVLRGIEGGAGALEGIVSVFGFLRETNYGRLFDVRTTAQPNNLAFTDQGLAPHTDNPYREPPPSLQLLHCIETADAGGQTILVDGFAAADRIRAQDAEAFALLSSTPVRFSWRDASNALEASAPVLELNARGDVAALRVNDRALAPLDFPPETASAWRDAYRKLLAWVNDPHMQTRLTLESDDVLIFDNRRMLHGRTAFQGGARWLQGCYADMDGLLSRLAVLERREAQARAGAAIAALAGPAGDESYGEGVSLRAHSLQSAALASASGLGPQLVAAALMHDVGWALGGVHEQTGAALVARLFGDVVARPIRLHVDAKRYLVATELDYLAALSSASKETLTMQGGPMNAQQARAFETESGFSDALTLRRIDDQAKDPSAQTLTLEAYRELLEDVALSAVQREGL